MAIQGDGFFRVANSAASLPAAAFVHEHEPRVHPGGQLHDEHQGYLTTQGGMYVLGYGATAPVAPSTNYTINTAGGPDNLIQIPTNGTDIAVGQDGGVTYVDPLRRTAEDRGLHLARDVPERGGSAAARRVAVAPTANSGAATVGTPGVNGMGATISGELEMSNVDLANEFTNMITAQRGFQANSRVISTADEMLQTLVNLKQLIVTGGTERQSRDAAPPHTRSQRKRDTMITLHRLGHPGEEFLVNPD